MTPTTPRPRPSRAGRLIAVEGVDGSGKSTQLHLLEQWLRHQNLKVFKTDWNSSETVKEITSRGKKKGLLTPTTFSLLHATDFADRYERNILPLLEAGYFVLADRYVYTAYARDIVRGCHPQWVRKIYSYAAKPDLTLYFRVPVDVAVSRILAGRPKLKYYEAGMDMNLSNDPYESYRIFQGRIVDQYESLRPDRRARPRRCQPRHRGAADGGARPCDQAVRTDGLGPMTTPVVGDLGKTR